MPGISVSKLGIPFRTGGRDVLLYKITKDIAISWTESNRDGIPCNYFLISQPIDNDYKNFLIYNLIIQI